MSSIKNISRLAASTGLAAFTLAAMPAQAAPKTPKVTMSASAVQDPSKRLCMPKTVLGPGVSRDLPKTICQTRDEWTAQGLTIVVK